MDNRELDGLIAERVFGWQSLPLEGMEFFKEYADKEYVRMAPDGSWQRPPTYSTSIADAWQVVEHLLVNGAPHVHVWYDRQVWKCRVDLPEGQGWYSRPANTAPEAICKAALDCVVRAAGGESE